MIGWEFLDCASVPGGGTLELWRHGREVSIRVDSRDLMSSAMHGSEDALAELACALLHGYGQPRVLIGGLGMGFTLAAALRCLGPGARVVVAELVPAIVRWNRGILADLSGRALEDDRVQVHEGDVARLVRDSHAAWDAILLDVDNGPRGLTTPTNDWLYGPGGLDALFDALVPAGIIGVWSAFCDPRFTRRLGFAGFDATAHEVRSRGSKGGSKHTVWVGVRGERPPEHPRWREPTGGTFP